jgi:hypothetical protein
MTHLLDKAEKQKAYPLKFTYFQKKEENTTKYAMFIVLYSILCSKRNHLFPFV